MAFGVWEGLTRPEVVEQYPEIYYTRYQDVLSTRVPGGELPHEVVARFRDFMDELLPKHGEETIVLVSHGGTPPTGHSQHSPHAPGEILLF